MNRFCVVTPFAFIANEIINHIVTTYASLPLRVFPPDNSGAERRKLQSFSFFFSGKDFLSELGKHPRKTI